MENGKRNAITDENLPVTPSRDRSSAGQPVRFRIQENRLLSSESARHALRLRKRSPR